jgi:CheY-like chemotaxis protein
MLEKMLKDFAPAESEMAVEAFSFLKSIKLIPENKQINIAIAPVKKKILYKKKILVVDDEGSCRDFFRNVIEDEGLMYLEAHDGQEAIKMMNGNPDIVLVFVDLKMPVMNGLSLLKMVRSLKMMEWATFVVTSEQTSKEIIEHLKKLKVSGLVPKPLEKKNIVSSLKKFLHLEDQAA